MTDKKPGLAEFIANNEPDGARDGHLSAQTNTLELALMGLARIYSVNPKALARELSNDTILAKIVGDLIGFPPRPVSVKSHASDGRNWTLFILIESYRQSGLTLDAALNAHIDRLDSVGRPSPSLETLKRKYNRLKKLWSVHDVPMPGAGLAALFEPPPARKTKIQ